MLAPLLVAGCHPAESPKAAAPKRSCEIKQGLRDGNCRQLRLEDGSVVRYVLMRGEAHARETTLVDLGGPGVSLFGAQWPSGLPTTLPARLRSSNVLLLEEPWVTRKYTRECREETSAVYRRARRGHLPDASRLVSRCQLDQAVWGWTPARYRDSVAAIAQTEHVHLNAFVGASFAARRLAYLGAEFETNLLVDPAPPLTSPAGTYLDDRREAVFERIRRYACSGCTDSSISRVLSTASRRLKTDPVHVDGRSVDVADGDVGAATIAVGYQQPATVKASWAALRDPSTVAHATLIGRLSDSAWGRVGIEDLSPAWLAYLAEVCPAFSDWDSALVSPAQGDPVQRFLQQRHAPCSGMATHVAPSVRVPRGSMSCVTFSTDDGVIARRAIRPWRSIPGVAVRESAGRRHGDLGSLTRCSN